MWHRPEKDCREVLKITKPRQLALMSAKTKAPRGWGYAGDVS